MLLHRCGKYCPLEVQLFKVVPRRVVTHEYFGFGPLFTGRRHGATGKDNCLKDATALSGSGVDAASSGSGAAHGGTVSKSIYLPPEKLLELAQLSKKTEKTEIVASFCQSQVRFPTFHWPNRRQTFKWARLMATAGCPRCPNRSPQR